MDGALLDRCPAATAEQLRRADGALTAAVDLRAGRPRLHHLYQHQPLRGLTPQPAAGEPLTLVVANLSGGMVGGDRYRVTVAAEAGADLLVCGQAAEKVYRSAGADTDVAVDLTVDDDAVIEWLPQGTILFDGARLSRRTTVHMAARARLLAGEILVFGRLGRGEVMRCGRLDDHWRVRVGGRLVWADALRLDGAVQAVLDHPAALGGGRALATGLFVAPSAADLLEEARAALDRLADGGVRAAATAMPGLLLVRLLGEDAASVRRAFGRFWSWLRATALGRPSRLPVLWHV